MPRTWEWYLPDVSTERIAQLLRDCGVPEPDAESWTQGVLRRAALCRLAFASVEGTTDRVPRSAYPAEAVISQTEYGLRRGRPRTARWALWAAYMLCEELNMHGTPPAYQFAATLIGSLLGRTMPPGEVKKLFVGVQREADAHALLEHKLKKEWSPKQFRPWIKGMLGDGLPATAERPPIIEQGQVSDQWLQALMNTRRAILHRVNTCGPLAGHRPEVWVASESRILTRLPLGSSPGPGGTIHFGKALEVPTPSLPFEGGTTSVSFPRRWLDSPPSAAVLYAVPVYWHQWQAHFVARPKKMKFGKRAGKRKS